jgi:hypothetical protein
MQSLHVEASSASEHLSRGELASLDLGEVARGGEIGLVHEGRRMSRREG